MMQREHLASIETRRLFVLPDYELILGDHPFVATTLSKIANSYHALGDFDNAIKFTRRALEIRIKLLGHHQETAQSFYDLGVALSARKEYERWVVIIIIYNNNLCISSAHLNITMIRCAFLRCSKRTNKQMSN